MRTDVDACDCTRGLYAGHRWKVCTEKSLATPGLEPASVLRLAFQSDQLSYPRPFIPVHHGASLLQRVLNIQFDSFYFLPLKKGRGV